MMNESSLTLTVIMGSSCAHLHGVARGEVGAQDVALVRAVRVDEVVGQGGAALEVVHDVALVHVPEANGGFLRQPVPCVRIDP